MAALSPCVPCVPVSCSWAGARQLGVCMLQALPGCSPELWGAAPAGAWLKGGFQTGLSLLHSESSQSNVRGGQKRRRAAGSPSQRLVPVRSASLQRPCALGQTVTCCGGMSHTTTKSLVFHREPGAVSILIPLGLAGSVPSPCY